MLDDVTEEERDQSRKEVVIVLVMSALIVAGLITMIVSVDVGGTMCFIGILGMLAGILSMLNE